MKKSDIFEFIRDNPIFALATVEDGSVRVRMMKIYRADENGIIFNTGENKDVHKQLQYNPEVELCFFNIDEEKQIRITGSVEVVEDALLKKEIGDDFPFLKKWVDSEGYDVLVVYCLKHGKAATWTMPTNFKPKEYVQL
jgi:pyridoxamine 5'-phosphate oxidase